MPARRTESRKIVEENETWLRICREDLHDSGYDISIPEERISKDVKWKYYRNGVLNGNFNNSEYFINRLKTEYGYEAKEGEIPPPPNAPMSLMVTKKREKEVFVIAT